MINIEALTIKECLRKAIELSDIKDREICIALEIHPTVFSKILNGIRSFPADKINQFCEVVGNTLLLEWLCSRSGGSYMNNSDLTSKQSIEEIIDKKIKQSNRELVSAIKEGLEHGNSEALRMISEKLNPDESTN